MNSSEGNNGRREIRPSKGIAAKNGLIVEELGVDLTDIYVLKEAEDDPANLLLHF